MNYSRIAIAAIAAFVADAVYGFVVYGNLLTSEFGLYPGIFRSPDAQMAYLPGMFVAILIGMFVMTYIYAKGYDGGSGIQEGIRFGILIGLFNATYVVWAGHAVMQLDLRIAGIMAVAGLVEWAVVGAVMGVVYKPAVSAVRRGARVRLASVLNRRPCR